MNKKRLKQNQAKEEEQDETQLKEEEVRQCRAEMWIWLIKKLIFIISLININISSFGNILYNSFLLLLVIFEPNNIYKSKTIFFNNIIFFLNVFHIFFRIKKYIKPQHPKFYQHLLFHFLLLIIVILISNIFFFPFFYSVINTRNKNVIFIIIFIT